MADRNSLSQRYDSVKTLTINRKASGICCSTGIHVYARIPTNPRPSWCQDSEAARTQSEPKRLRGTFVLSIKSECLDRIVPRGEAHLRRAIPEYVAHYHHERNHEGGLGNVLIDGNLQDAARMGALARRERRGGLLNFYYRQVA
jgi:hypothetical protein